MCYVTVTIAAHACTAALCQLSFIIISAYIIISNNSQIYLMIISHVKEIQAYSNDEVYIEAHAHSLLIILVQPN